MSGQVRAQEAWIPEGLLRSGTALELERESVNTGSGEQQADSKPTLMYWNSSTGDSDRGDRSEALGTPLGLLCGFLVIRSSLLRIATTILSSLLW